MARRRFNSGKFAENFAKSFTSTLSALSRAKYYDALTKREEAKLEKEKNSPSNDAVMDHINKYLNGNGGDSTGGGKALTSEQQQAAARKYMDYMVNEKGVDPKVAAGIIGNIAQESGFNPRIKGDNGNSFGLFQFNKKGEMPNLEKWAAENKRDVNDDYAQIDHVLEQKNGRFKGMFERMEKARDAKEASTIFSDEYERPSAKHARNENRAAIADQAFNGWKGLTERRQKSEARYKTGAVKSEELPPAEGEKKEEAAIPAAPARLPTFARTPAPAPVTPEAPTTAEKPAEVPAEVPAEAPAEASVEPQKTGALDLQAPTDTASLDTDDALGLSSGNEDFTQFAAEGGPISEEPGASLDQAIAAALTGVQNEYGLGQDTSALPGPERQQDMQEFARNAGGMTPDEMESVVRTVDPDGRMPRGAANAVALQQLYGHFAKTAGPEVAQEAASSFIQGARNQSMKLGSLALAAMENGDMPGAGKALMESYNQIPDGKIVEGQVDPNGNGVAVVKDVQTGKPVQQMRLTPQLLQMAAQKLANGSEFYNHLSRHAGAPQQRTQQMSGGGLAGDWGAEAGETYDSEDPDEQLRQDAALASNEDNSGNDDGGDDTESALPAPTPSRTALPKQPDVIPYMQGMTPEQRRYLDRVNAARQNEWKSQVSAYQKSITDEVIRRRGEDSANRRMAFQEGQSNKRTEFQERQATKRMTQQEQMQTDRQRESDRQARLRDERGRNNGLTREDMVRDLAESDAKGTVAKYLAGKKMEESGFGAGALPAEVTGGQNPNYPAPDEAMRMPAGTNDITSPDQIEGAIGTRFDREFGLPAAKRIQMARLRQDAQEDREFTAADNAAKASRVDRKDLDKLDEFINDKENGLFTDVDKDNPKKRVYLGDQIPPIERTAIRNWAWKAASFNPDMPPETAAQTINSLLAVQKDKDGNPINEPNYKISVDPKTGMGRVQHKNGLIAFNLDKESLRQVGMLRQSRLLKAQEDKAAEDKQKDLELKLKAQRAALDARLKEMYGSIPMASDKALEALGPEGTISGRQIQENFSPTRGMPQPEGAIPRFIPGQEFDPFTNKFQGSSR